MSTERSPHAPRPTDPGADPDGTAKPKIDLSLTQVLGGALAAMTAAFVGSRLSVAGTLAGAALASVVAAVAGNLYTASLRASRERVRTVFRGRVGDSEVPATVATVDERDLETTLLAPVRPDAPGTVRPAPASRGRVRLQWRSVLLGALAVFALAAVALTGLELATGQALSGGDGTTLSQVAEPAPAAPADDTTPSASPSSSDSPSASPSASERVAPEPAPSASSAGPTPSPSSSAATPSLAPSAPPSTPSTSAPAPTPTPSTGG